MATLVQKGRGGREGGAFSIPWAGELPRSPGPHLLHQAESSVAWEERQRWTLSKREQQTGREEQARDVRTKHKHAGPSIASPAANSPQKPHQGPLLQIRARCGRMNPHPIPFPVEWPESKGKWPLGRGGSLRPRELRFFQLPEQEGIGLYRDPPCRKAPRGPSEHSRTPHVSCLSQRKLQPSYDIPWPGL